MVSPPAVVVEVNRDWSRTEKWRSAGSYSFSSSFLLVSTGILEYMTVFHCRAVVHDSSWIELPWSTPFFRGNWLPSHKYSHAWADLPPPRRRCHTHSCGAGHRRCGPNLTSQRASERARRSAHKKKGGGQEAKKYGEEHVKPAPKSGRHHHHSNTSSSTTTAIRAAPPPNQGNTSGTTTTATRGRDRGIIGDGLLRTINNEGSQVSAACRCRTGQPVQADT